MLLALGIVVWTSPPPAILVTLGGLMLVQDFYWKVVFFQLQSMGEISVNNDEKGLILAITPIKSIKKADIPG
jgi:hypothetical protein